MPGGKDEKNERPAWIGFAGEGVELVAVVVGLALLGYWIDRHSGTAPWGVVVGSVLGLVGGMYNFIRAAVKATRADEPDRSDEDR